MSELVIVQGRYGADLYRVEKVTATRVYGTIVKPGTGYTGKFVHMSKVVMRDANEVVFDEYAALLKERGERLTYARVEVDKWYQGERSRILGTKPTP